MMRCAAFCLLSLSTGWTETCVVKLLFPCSRPQVCSPLVLLGVHDSSARTLPTSCARFCRRLSEPRTACKLGVSPARSRLWEQLEHRLAKKLLPCRPNVKPNLWRATSLFFHLGPRRRTEGF
ncbi:hypothetical protein, variant [Verruconis gallopava]|uniref:Secreted protein n=1 Tax=Verruconis gallopava TaxID=253628 RepID=A0A0D2B023_9PEZI|nr:hypothetical protein, variant [Verruconis gallopava]KIW04724.1 hypothetical protein, variant [Verruconis gallopava]